MALERYNRQELIKGWKQKKIRNSKVILIGSERLSDLMLVDLLSIGINNIKRVGYSDFFEFEKINPEASLEQIAEEIYNSLLAEMHIDEADFVIETTNSLESKFFSSVRAKEKGISYLSASSTPDKFKLAIDKYGEELIEFHQDDYRLKQGNINSLVCTGILTDELRKKIIPLKDDIFIQTLIYSDIKEQENLDKKVLQVGAGAVGTFSALLLSLMNTNLTLVDFDVIEESNLNRQFLFYNSVGLNKAEVLAERLKKYSDNIKVVNEKIKENFNPEEYDIVLSCVDNNEAREYMNLSSLRYGVPLINGGSSLFAGTAMSYFPGKTACLDCQTGFKLSENKKPKNKKRRNNCFQPSLIISNQIIGGLTVNCLLKGIQGIYEKTNYVSGGGIYKQKINSKCYESCPVSVKN